MRNIRIENVTKIFNGKVVLDNLSLNIPSGKFFTLLGPSGSGKTTLLRLIGGLDKVDKGKIFLGDQDITDLPINKRNIHTVFQDYALFPHLNVFDNIAYSLSLKKVPKDVIKDKVIKALKTVNLESFAYRRIEKLSGGERQRVALLRAIMDEPDVLLLDEPLTALDFKLKERVLIELIELQEKLKTTFIYVTHDQFEALTVSDQMLIMNNGEIEQIGTPKEIYEFPISTFVAQFVGTTNLLHGKLLEDQDNYYVDVPGLGKFEVHMPEHKKWMVSGKTNESGTCKVNACDVARAMSIRPEKIFITKKITAGFSNVVEGVVETIVYHGRSTQYNVRLKNDITLQVFEQNEEHFPQEVIDYDNTVYLYWQKENVVLLER